MADDFAHHSESLISPADDAAAVTPGAEALAKVTRALYIGADGDVEVIMLNGTGPIVFAGCKGGTILPIRVTHVLADNTDADDIVALW